MMMMMMMMGDEKEEMKCLRLRKRNQNNVLHFSS